MPGYCERRDVRQQRPRVEVDRVPARRPDDRHAGRDELLARGTRSTGCGSAGTAPRPLPRDHARWPRGRSRPARRRSETPRSGSAGCAPPRPTRSLFIARKPPMFARPSFLADIVQPSASENISCAMAFGRPSAVARLALLDEPGVLGKPAGVEEERLPVPVAEPPDAAQVLQRHRLAAARVVGDRHHDQRHPVARARRAARSSASRSMLPLNGMHDVRDARPRG